MEAKGAIVSLIVLLVIGLLISREMPLVQAHDLEDSFTGEYIQPNDLSVQAIVNTICAFPLEENVYDNVRSVYFWVVDHIEYESDGSQWGEDDYWQLPATTILLGTGDCEDQAILLTSLIRAVGVSRSQVHLVIGKVTNIITGEVNGHGWVEVWLSGHGWIPLDSTRGKLWILSIPFETWILLGYNVYLGELLTAEPTAFFVDPPPSLATLTVTPSFSIVGSSVTIYMELSDSEWHDLDVTIIKPNGDVHTITVYLWGRHDQSLLYGRDLGTSVDQFGTYTVRVAEQWDDPLPNSINPTPRTRSRVVGETFFTVFRLNAVPEMPFGTVMTVLTMVGALGVFLRQKARAHSHASPFRTP